MSKNSHRQVRRRHRIGRRSRCPATAPFSLVSALLLALLVAPTHCVWADDDRKEEGGQTLGFSLGTELLVRAENRSAEGGPQEPGFTFRVRPSVALELTPELQVRLTVQGYQAHDHVQEPRVGLYEMFAQWQPDHMFSLAVGRQELAFGSAFLLGADSFFDGSSFDAVRASLRGSQGLGLTLFAGRYVRRWSGGMAGTLWGLWGEAPVGEGGAVEAFFVRDTGGEGLRHRGGAHEQTDSWGLWAKIPWGPGRSLEIEPVWQTGHKVVGGGIRRPIRAYGGHADVTWSWSGGGAERSLFFSLAWASGDGQPQTGPFTEFHHPNTDTPLVGDSNLVGDLSGISWKQEDGQSVRTSGLTVLTAGFTTATSQLSFTAHAHLFRADSVPPGWAHTLGLEADLSLSLHVSQEVSLVVGVNGFSPTPRLARYLARAQRRYLFAQLVVSPQRLIWQGRSSSD
ncbi:alginate export family protein [Thermoanaerobaculum aquaticum]|uniref:alginate export family protein n=1 Tax=Thermoanaerobaculum aquaticum TaxID=1312852 RepID=UPI0009DCB033|nr:alginate export family protein [Thermoanaerobaculum aquaticum]